MSLSMQLSQSALDNARRLKKLLAEYADSLEETKRATDAKSHDDSYARYAAWDKAINRQADLFRSCCNLAGLVADAVQERRLKIDLIPLSRFLELWRREDAIMAHEVDSRRITLAVQCQAATEKIIAALGKRGRRATVNADEVVVLYKQLAGQHEKRNDLKDAIANKLNCCRRTVHTKLEEKGLIGLRPAKPDDDSAELKRGKVMAARLTFCRRRAK
jgi:hypothetical protein